MKIEDLLQNSFKKVCNVFMGDYLNFIRGRGSEIFANKCKNGTQCPEGANDSPPLFMGCRLNKSGVCVANFQRRDTFINLAGSTLAFPTLSTHLLYFIFRVQKWLRLINTL